MPNMTQQRRTCEIGDTPLLSADEEKSLSKMVEGGLLAQERLEAEDALPLTPADKSKMRRISRDGIAAEQHFVKANLRLVAHHIKRMTIPYGVSEDDVFQDGAEALHTAVRKFDWRREFKFSTYASWWVRQAISQSISKQTGSISGATQVRNLARQSDRVRRDMALYLGRSATDSEVADVMSVTVERLHEIHACSRSTISFQQPVNNTEGDGLVLGDMLSDPDAEEHFNAVDVGDRLEVIQRILAALPEDEREALLREANKDKPPRGHSMKKHRASVRRAVSRLRHPTNTIAEEAMDYV